jgi:choline dehydrogenase
MSLRGSEYDWCYKTTMIDRPDYTRIEKPNTRGKVLGGSTSLNYYTWVRGSAASMDDWEEFGGSTWNWKNTKDYFNKSTTYHDDHGLFPDSLHSIGNKGGPLHISHSDLVPELQPWRDALEKAWVSKGQELTVDVYNGVQKGLFKCVNSIYKGVRSTSASFLEGKPNVTIVSSTISKQINFEGKAAVGVTVVGPDSREYSFFANKEVIIAQGVYESAKILLLSGIGTKSDLEALSIQSVVDSRHVGQNLLDHPILSHVFKIKDGYGLDGHLLRAGAAHDGALAAYRKSHGGPYSSGLLELVAFPRVDERLEKIKAYRDYKAQNGGKDPFGPAGQPHFEIDFVVGRIPRAAVSSFVLTLAIAHVCRRLPVALPHASYRGLHDHNCGPHEAHLAHRGCQAHFYGPLRAAVYQSQLLRQRSRPGRPPRGSSMGRRHPYDW